VVSVFKSPKRLARAKTSCRVSVAGYATMMLMTTPLSDVGNQTHLLIN
jgi:hypothetical protein